MKISQDKKFIPDKFIWWSAVLVFAFVAAGLGQFAAAQDQQDQYDQPGDQQDDPPGRVARLGYMEGSVSFQPGGEEEWVQAVSNRPMTTGDKLWADRDSRAELELGSAVVRLSANTGLSFLNLDDRSTQIQLTSGSLNINVRQLDRDDAFEVDTPNQAFSIFQPGSYRVEASEDGNYTVVSVRQGEGESTGNGQNFTLHAGQRGTFSGTDSLTADVAQIGGPDAFDNWAYGRDHRYENSRSAQYVSHDVVGYDDLDDNGDWRDDSNYGHVWYPNRVAADWAPYRDGHWDWIAPWGWTWVDDQSWGYAPFHYGRWVTVGGRWGWVAGPVAVRAVYAPALVVFIGAGGGGFGGNVGWFPLGPREVYVPSYRVSRGYVNRVNVSNTTVTNVNITNVYNTTIVNKTTNITNVTYVNRNVRGAVTAVPQRTFVSAQPVARAAVAVNARDIQSAPVTARAAVAPVRESVLGAKAATANRVAAPPAAIAKRQVIAKATPPPPPVAFAKQQQALARNPGQPLAKQEVKSLRPTTTAEAHPLVKMAPPGKPATPNAGRPAGQPSNQPNAAKPGTPANSSPANQPANRPGNAAAPNEHPGAANPAQPGQPSARPVQPQPGRPEANRPAEAPARGDRPEANTDNLPRAARPAQPSNAPPPNQPANRPGNEPAGNERPGANNKPEQPNRPDTNARPEPNRPEPNRPQPNRPQPNRPEPNNRPEANRPERPNNDSRPPAARPDNRPEPNRAEPNRPNPPARNDRPPAAQQERPTPNRPEAKQPQPQGAQSNERPRTPDARPASPQGQRPKPQTPEEKKQEDKKRREQQKPPAE